MSPKLLMMITSFLEAMQGFVQYDGSSLDPFPVRNGVKQGCVLALTLLASSSPCCSLMSSVSQKMAYTSAPEVMETSLALHASAKTKVHRILIRELLFADDAALTAHTEEALQ